MIVSIESELQKYPSVIGSELREYTIVIGSNGICTRQVPKGRKAPYLLVKVAMTIDLMMKDLNR
jgi:hypothetical protein